MIVLEGPDGSGKTSLAELMQEELGLEYRRPPKEVLSSSQGPTGEPRGLIEWWLEELDKCQTQHNYAKIGVYDRTTFISDPIYRLAMGGMPQGTIKEMMGGVYYLANYAYVKVFCLPDFETTLLNVKREGRDKLALPDDKLYVIWWAYHWVYQMMSEADFEGTIKYDYTDDGHSRELVMEAVKKYVGRS